MSRTIGRLSAALLGVVIVIYAGVVAYVALNQSSFFYAPDTAVAAVEGAASSGFEVVRLKTSDGEHINGWWRSPEGAAGVVLYLHGNGGNLQGRAARLRDIADSGAGVLAIDYRGYGGSTGHPTEAGLYSDARAAWKFLQAQASGRPVVIWGESLGTAVATQLATEVDETGVVLDSPFASMVQMVRAGALWFPSPLVRHRYETVRKIARIGSPLLVAHCDADQTVPFTQGRLVYAAAGKPKQFVAMHGCGHIEIWSDPARSEILRFLSLRIGSNPPS